MKEMKFRRIRITPSVIPNLFTAMNMFCGFLSIISASQANYIYAAWLIIIASLFDALDGFMARLTKSSSELGVELDSLSDVISFGAAPAFLIYTVFLIDYNAWGVIIASLPMIAGGFRLARFNVQLVGFDKDYFKGLPIPASGIAIAALVLAFHQTGVGFPEKLQGFIIPLILILSYLMVSTIKYDTIPKFRKKELTERPQFIIFALLTVVLVVLTTPGRALFFIFVLIILFGIFRHLFNFFAKKN
jgi:CDP-diacylglycerol---serine O-phosphatidyltransferase